MPVPHAVSRLARASGLALFLGAFGIPAFAAGSDGGGSPSPTPTTTECTDGKVYDEKTKTCVDAESNLIDDDTRYDAIRELAYAAQYDRALMVLATAERQDDPRMLNYRGFIARKLGDLDTAMVFYEKALAADPDYLLARSYMGQGLIAQGDLVGALAQLREIEARGGAGGWPHQALDKALRGMPTDY